MTQPRIEIAPSFRQIARTSEEEHGGTVGLMSYLYRPNDKRTNKFDSARVALDKFTMLVHRPQWRHHKGRVIRSNVVAVYAFQYNRLTGRISVDAHADEACNPVAWDVAVPRSAKLAAPHVMNPEKNRTGAQAAILLHRAALAAVRHGGDVELEPSFPEFYCVFHPSQPPHPERTGNLLQAVRVARPELASAPDEAIPDEACREVFQSLLVRNRGRIFAPQWLLGRETGDSFPVHPRTGEARPEIGAPDWTQAGGGWIMVDGNWVPRAQEPAAVVADLSGVLGRQSTDAWQLLVERGLLPDVPHAEWAAACTDEDWGKFREEVLAPLFPAGEHNDLADDWRVRTATARGFDDEDVACLAFDDVRQPLAFDGESRVGVVRLQGYPSPEVMTFRHYGFDADLFSVKGWLEPWVRPITPRDIDRLRRGLSVLPPRRGGRRPARRP